MQLLQLLYFEWENDNSAYLSLRFLQPASIQYCKSISLTDKMQSQERWFSIANCALIDNFLGIPLEVVCITFWVLSHLSWNGRIISAPRFSEKLHNWRIFKIKIILSSAWKQLALAQVTKFHSWAPISTRAVLSCETIIRKKLLSYAEFECLNFTKLPEFVA